MSSSRIPFSVRDPIIVSDNATTSKSYFMKAGITANYIIMTATGNDILLTNTTERFNGINTNFGDWNNNLWVCPKTAIYNLNASLRLAGSSGDAIQKLFVKIAIMDSTGNVIRILNQGGIDDARTVTSAALRNWSINCFAMEQIVVGEKIGLVMEWDVTTGGVIIQGGVSPDATFLTVERII